MAKKVMDPALFKSGKDRKTEWVELSDLYGTEPEEGYWVRGLSGVERGAYEQTNMAAKRNRKGNVTGFEPALDNAQARLVVRCIVDAEHGGKRIFRDADADDVGEKVGGAALNRLYEAAARLSGIREEDLEELKKSCEKTHSVNGSAS